MNKNTLPASRDSWGATPNSKGGKTGLENKYPHGERVWQVLISTLLLLEPTQQHLGLGAQGKDGQVGWVKIQCLGPSALQISLILSCRAWRTSAAEEERAF